MFADSPLDLGRTGVVKHRIDTGNHRPIKQPPRRVPMHRRDIVQNEIDKMLDRGVIEHCDGPWSSPIVLVAKKGGDLRFCVDFRELNEITKKDAYPLPRIEDNLDCLQGAHWYSTLDLLSGFWQVEVEEEDRDKTAFTVGGMGLFRFVTMPFGLCNAPATFQRLMEHVLSGLTWQVAVLYIDDIIVFSSTLEEHMERLGQVLTRLRSAGLTLKPTKCKLMRHKVEFLGHIVSAEGVAVDPAKIAKVIAWPTPKSLTQLRSFLGLCAYYRKFIKSFSTVAKPFYRLMEKGQAFLFCQLCQEAFNALKTALTQAPILAYPRIDAPFVLDTDASNVGIGAVLSQVQEGVERVISYSSKTLNRHQRNYCVTRREMLAVVFHVEYYQHYLHGKEFLLRTDHAALYWLLRKRNPPSQMARWIVILGLYQFKIEHRPGLKHGNADALSRCMEGCTDADTLAIPAGTQATYQEIKDMAAKVLPVRVVKTRAQCKRELIEACQESEDMLPDFFSQFQPLEPEIQPENDPIYPAVIVPVVKPGRGDAPQNPETTEASPTEPQTRANHSQPAPEQTTPETPVPPPAQDDVPEDADTLFKQYVTMEAADESSGADQAPEEADLPPMAPETQHNQPLLDQLADDERLKQYVNDVLPAEWAPEAIAYIQEHDPDLAVVRAWVRQEHKPSWTDVFPHSATIKAWHNRFDQLYLSPQNQVLYLTWHDPKPHRPVRHRVLAVPAMYPAIMAEVHDAKTSGHLGRNKTIDRLKMSPFYWPGMMEYAARWVRNCRKCNARKDPPCKKRSPLQNFHAGATADRYSCDLTGPFKPAASDGSRWIFTITDWFTRFTKAFPLKRATAFQVARCIMDFMSLFCCPIQLYSDNGAQIHGRVVKELCRLLGVKKLATVPYRPSSNGKTERQNKVIKDCLAAFVNRRASDWPLHLDAVMMAARSAVHTAMNETPNMMMLGREVRLPVDLLVGGPPELEYEVVTHSEYAASLVEAMRDIHAVVTQHLGPYYRYQKAYYDKGVHAVEYTVGQAVWLRTYARDLDSPSAFADRWDETWIVLGRVTAVHYRIQKTPYGEQRIVHGDKIKIHYGEILDLATRRLWLSLQPNASRVDRLAVEPCYHLSGPPPPTIYCRVIQHRIDATKTPR